MNDYQQRISQFQNALKRAGAAVAVLSFSDQMRYLTGFAEQGHERLLALFVPAEGEPVFVVPSLNAAQASANPAGIEHVVGWSDAEGWGGAVKNLLAGYDAEDAVILVDDELPSGHLLAIQEMFPSARYAPAGAILTTIRRRKTPAELASMREAARLIDVIFEESVAELRDGVTERQVQAFLMKRFEHYGTSPAFTPIVGFSENGALPHHSGSDRPLRRGDVIVLDMGCLSDRYNSDITRTVAFGEPSDPDARKVYDTVYRAHMAARAVVRPGTTCEAVDAAARMVIEDAGYDEYFTHRTGHGIGLSEHEPPSIVAGEKLALEPGMCFSIEPGIYLPGRFGVRIENIVTVTDNGYTSLNAEPAPELRISP